MVAEGKIGINASVEYVITQQCSEGLPTVVYWLYNDALG